MGILQILASDNFITVNRTVASIVGLEAAVIFGELASEHNYWKEHSTGWDGSFFSTVENLEKRTFLSAHQQREAIKRLEDQGWLTMEKRGMPAKRYIRMNEEKIIESLNDQSLKFLTTSDAKFERQDVKKLHGNNNIQNKNIEKEKRKEDRHPSEELKLETDPKTSASRTTRAEMKELVQLTAGAFPNKKINEEKTIDAWMLSLSEYEPMIIQTAIINHMTNSVYFPSPKDLRKNIQRAQLTQQAPEKTSQPSHHSGRGISDEQFETILGDIL